MHCTSTTGLEIGYDEYGDGDPLLLVMGLAASRVAWPPAFCEQLGRRGFRVIALDNRDVGESTWLTDDVVPSVGMSLLQRAVRRRVNAPYTLSHMASDTIGLLDALGLNSAHVVGASLGGMIAQTAAIEHPGRVRTLTSIMSNPGTLRHTIGSPRALRALLRPPPKTRAEAMEKNEAMFRVLGGDLPMDFEFIRERAGVNWDRGRNPAAFARQWAAIMASGSRLSALRQLDVPALVVHGTADPLIPLRAGRVTARAIPGARFLAIDGMGHEFAPATWTPIIDAISQLRDRNN